LNQVLDIRKTRRRRGFYQDLQTPHFELDLSFVKDFCGLGENIESSEDDTERKKLIKERAAILSLKINFQ